MLFSRINVRAIGAVIQSAVGKVAPEVTQSNRGPTDFDWMVAERVVLERRLAQLNAGILHAARRRNDRRPRYEIKLEGCDISLPRLRRERADWRNKNKDAPLVEFVLRIDRQDDILLEDVPGLVRAHEYGREGLETAMTNEVARIEAWHVIVGDE